MICCQLLIGKADQFYGEDSEDLMADSDMASKDKLADLLKDQLNKYVDADLTELEFEKNADYNKNTVEGTRNVLKVLIALPLLVFLLRLLLCSLLG